MIFTSGLRFPQKGLEESPSSRRRPEPSSSTSIKVDAGVTRLDGSSRYGSSSADGAASQGGQGCRGVRH
jgi:hypothetical protein